jgi:hypothetical protein
MSQLEVLPVAPVFACDTCQRLLALKICKSNKNGNAGRLFTACYKKHENGTSCSYFKWADDRLSPPTSRFASSSPICSPTLSAPSSAQPATLAPTPQLSPPQTVTSGPTSCAKPGRNSCKSTLTANTGCAVDTVWRLVVVQRKVTMLLLQH